MKSKILQSKTLVCIGFLLALNVPATAQWKDNMGNTWNNPTSASIGSLVNDRLWERMRAKARARKRAGVGTTSSTETPSAIQARESEPEPPKKTAAQIKAATHFRSTGTQLVTRDLANASGNTAEEKERMFVIMGAALTEYEKEARKHGRQNDFALALAVALAVNSSVYHGTPEPDQARLFEIGDALGDLMTESNIFATGMTDRKKQEMFESMVIFTMLVQVGSNEARQTGNAAEMETYRQLAAKVLQNISGMSPEKIRFDAQPALVAADDPAPRREEPISTVPAAGGDAIHVVTLVKDFENNEIRARQTWAGKRVRFYGTINVIEAKKDGRISMTFKASLGAYGNVRCFFNQSQTSRVATLTSNQEATFEGTVRGWEDGYDGAKVFVLVENCVVP
jgi:hypothetical protein